MLPTIAYLNSPTMLRALQPSQVAETKIDRSGGAQRSLQFRSAMATIVALLTTVAVAAPSWAGPAGGC